MYKNKTRLGSNFHLKDQIPKDLTSGVFYRFQSRHSNGFYYGECMRHLNVRIGQHMSILPLTRKQVKTKNSSVANHLLLSNHSASYDNFSILTRDNKKLLLELKESLLIMRDKPSFNRNITSSPLYLARISFVLIVALLFLLYGLFYYLAMCKCMSVTVRGNGTVQFAFFFIMRLNITIMTSCDSLIVILVT